MKTRCGWRRFGQMRSHGGRLLPFVLLLSLPAGLWPQTASTMMFATEVQLDLRLGGAQLSAGAQRRGYVV